MTNWRSRQGIHLELRDQRPLMADEDLPAARPQVMPIFMGAPWAQRYGGPGSELSLSEWRAQVEYLAGLQGLSAPQTLQFILNSLEGEARREVQAAPEATRATAQAVFDFLTGQYGDATPVAVLQTQFFNCKQGPRQTLRAFALRLREQFTRLKRRRDHGLGGKETLLRDQFLLGLREGPVRQSLRVQLRRDPELTFEDLRKEALALELDHAETADPSVCMAASGTSSSTSSGSSDWKQTLRVELMNDVREQMTELSKTLLEEFRRERPNPLPCLENVLTRMGAKTQEDAHSGLPALDSSGTSRVARFVMAVESLDTIVASAALAAVHRGVFRVTGHCGSSGRDPLD